MAEEKNPREAAGLIDRLLEIRDPATVGLRRIIKQKRDAVSDFPLLPVKPEDFSKQGSSSGGPNRVFTDDEKRVIELERDILRMRAEVEDVRKKSDEGINNAYRKGVADGTAAGLKEGEKRAKASYDVKLTEIFGRIALYLNEIESGRRTILVDAYADTLAIARAVARRILNTELSADSDTAARTVRAALSYIADKSRLRIRVNPTDLPNLTARADLWPSIADRLENVSLEPDERIERGGCIVESAGGIADARIETQTAAIQELIDRLWQELSTSSDFPPEAQHSLAEQHFPEAVLPDLPIPAAASAADAFVEDSPGRG